MSTETVLSPQPSASPPAGNKPAPAPSPAPSIAAAPAQPAAPASGDLLTAPKPGESVIGGNGSPDWRALLAGEDAKALEAVSRYKEPGELMKAFLEQRTKLSQRAEAPKLTEDSTPEQVAEYRKAFDVPEVPKEAKDEAYAEAYGLKLPEGVDISLAMLGAFARQMNSAHVPKATVQKVVGEYAKIQQAMAQKVEQTIAEKRKEWTGQLKDELGHREYDGQLEAARTYLKKEFEGREDEMTSLLAATLPSGGCLGDHPWFIKLIAGKAMGAGFTASIEANTLESGGKSLAQQQAEIEALQFKDPAAYNAASGRYEKILAARVARGEVDELGNEVRRRRSA